MSRARPRPSDPNAMTLSTIESAEFNESMRSFGMNSNGDNKSGSADLSNEKREGAPKRQSESILTKKERNTMKMSRIIVLFVLVLAGATATALTSRLTTDWEAQDFENQVSSCVLCDGCAM